MGRTFCIVENLRLVKCFPLDGMLCCVVPIVSQDGDLVDLLLLEEFHSFTTRHLHTNQTPFIGELCTSLNLINVHTFNYKSR